MPASEIAYPYIGLGDLDSAFHCLDRALAERDSMLVFLDVEPVFGPIREDPRYTAMRRRVGLYPGPPPLTPTPRRPPASTELQARERDSTPNLP